MEDVLNNPEFEEFFKDMDYIDVKHIEAETSLRAFITGMLSYYPWWIVMLYRVRQILVRLLGLVKHEKPEVFPSFRSEDISFTSGESTSFFIVCKAEEEKYWVSETPEDKHLIALGVIVEDVVEDIRYLSEKNHERNCFIGPDLIEKLVDASKQTRAKFYMPALIFLGAEHGAAKQEALSLAWKNIDFDFEGRGLIRLYRTKNKNERTQFLMPRTKQALLEWRDHLSWMRHRIKILTVQTDMVFCRLNGKPIQRFDKAWRRTCTLAGIDDFHYHDLRHTFCSNLILSGSDLKDVKEMIGHHDLAMTDRYSHLTQRHKQIRQDALAKFYENGINDTK